jgi:hypothetical protein
MANDEWVKHWMDGQMRKVRVMDVRDDCVVRVQLTDGWLKEHGVRSYANWVRAEPAPQPMVPNQFEQLRAELARLKAELAAVRANTQRAQEPPAIAAMNRAARHWPGMGGICQLTGRPFGL